MATKSTRNVKLVVKDGKTRLVRKSTLFTGAKKRKADRLAKRWEKAGRKT